MEIPVLASEAQSFGHGDENALLHGRAVMRCVGATEHLGAMSEVPVVRLGEHLRVTEARHPVELALRPRDIEVQAPSAPTRRDSSSLRGGRALRAFRAPCRTSPRPRRTLRGPGAWRPRDTRTRDRRRGRISRRRRRPRFRAGARGARRSARFRRPCHHHMVASILNTFSSGRSTVV